MNSNQKTVWIVFLVVLLLVVVVYAFRNGNGNGTGNGNAITIGFIAPLTGDAANLGIDAKAAVALAVDQVNQAGGVNGKELKVIYEDGQCNSAPASNAANKLINIDKVPVILGGLCSGETAAFAAAAKQANVVVFSPCSSAPSLSNASIFRDYPSDAYQGNFAADYIYNKLGKRNAAVMFVKSEYGQGIKQVFEDSFKKFGGKIVAEEGFDRNVADIRTQLAKVKAAKPDIVYFISYTDEAIVGLKQAADLGLKVPFFGGDAWTDPKIWQTVGNVANGDMYTTATAAHLADFEKQLEAKTGQTQVTVCAPFAYDAVKVLAQVMKVAGTDPSAIRTQLFKTTYVGGVSSDKISFDSNGDLVGANYSINIIQNGKSVAQ